MALATWNRDPCGSKSCRDHGCYSTHGCCQVTCAASTHTDTRPCTSYTIDTQGNHARACKESEAGSEGSERWHGCKETDGPTEHPDSGQQNFACRQALLLLHRRHCNQAAGPYMLVASSQHALHRCSWLTRIAGMLPRDQECPGTVTSSSAEARTVGGHVEAHVESLGRTARLRAPGRPQPAACAPYPGEPPAPRRLPRPRRCPSTDRWTPARQHRLLEPADAGAAAGSRAGLARLLANSCGAPIMATAPGNSTGCGYSVTPMRGGPPTWGEQGDTRHIEGLP